ncbi:MULTISPECIES: bifunctional cobalt-precorrin-7 (C(5))-methyltransferase/cobalt-precorrin-6B (C(15))-methyltransferase [unclassified Synechococcus]|uniref:bifunctional cobalt-precorrin-7 (C(5))-methyltransferase/cobalt-precorrin-6B (C(15))-methyltransferase n=1 Tax=unclassified Synechococcus TaxID=2626047 RepID=UPI00006993FA|nr:MULTISPECIES: bifunctional cobalt-precorrin-7 (C(5))-methyltransferase/cobalt-precorrin-6B (C(15))-methyltransferase [unclassified Synechococcus]EAQ76041.1 putative precorrin-6y methylase [Synechococcus sp. WH 5701]WFN58763.1 bifunctional cobalt-precorrin-7 (C(5))-methyltransferase/cobalt-precorrin-6B (C(15))-methyltransferase [Synechococcus sp. CCFWC 502]
MHPPHQPHCLEVIGTDAAGLASLPAPAAALVRQAELVAAPARLLPELRQALADAAQPPALIASDRPEQLFPQLEQALAAGWAVVLLASGDPLWFGISRLLLDRFPRECLRFHPAPSSLQLAFARLGRPWQDASWISLHGRDPEPLAAALQRRPAALAVLTDPGRGGAEEVRRILAASGLEAAYALWLCERLGHPQERVQRLAPQAALPADLDPLHLVLLIAEPPVPPDPAGLPLFGLEDGLWLQHTDRPGLMTKREVRIQLLADLELPASGVLWDVGAGVGSVGLEALRLRPALELWALERRGGSAALIRANAERLGVAPAGVLEGDALSVLEQGGPPDPDRVLLGGGGRQRLALLEIVLRRLRPLGQVVIPLATLEALAQLRPPLERAGLRVQVSQLQAWRGSPLAEGTRLAPLNPVLVLKGRRVD